MYSFYRLFKQEKTAAVKNGLSHQETPEQQNHGGNSGLFSQYVKRQGFAYYRDLAGTLIAIIVRLSPQKN